MRLNKILNYIKSIKFKFALFCVAGILSAIIDLVTFNILYNINVPFVISRTFAVLSAIAFTFIFNRNVTFSGRGKSIKKQIPKHIIIYILVLLTNIIVSSITLFILGDNSLNANIASIAGIVFAIPVSFFGSMHGTFK